jgi:hypothetical protein
LNPENLIGNAPAKRRAPLLRKELIPSHEGLIQKTPAIRYGGRRFCYRRNKRFGLIRDLCDAYRITGRNSYQGQMERNASVRGSAKGHHGL